MADNKLDRGDLFIIQEALKGLPEHPRHKITEVKVNEMLRDLLLEAAQRRCPSCGEDFGHLTDHERTSHEERCAMELEEHLNFLERKYTRERGLDF